MALTLSFVSFIKGIIAERIACLSPLAAVLTLSILVACALYIAVILVVWSSVNFSCVCRSFALSSGLFLIPPPCARHTAVIPIRKQHINRNFFIFLVF